MTAAIQTVRIVIPPARGISTGNRLTAERWAGMLRDRSVEATITEGDAVDPADAIIVLHGLKGRRALLGFRERHPDGRIVLALTGTDLYGDDGDADALRASMEAADRIVVLQDRCVARIPETLRDRTRVIVQSVEPLAEPAPTPRADPFVVAVVGHLRDVKDPLRAAAAARMLPATSRIEIHHAGAILEDRYRALVEREQAENPRYRFLDERTPLEARRLIASAQALVLSSRSEGGPAVIGEAVVDGTPVFGTRIDGVVGLLGDDHPGLFPVGDTAALADLLLRFETDPPFRAAMRDAVVRHGPRFAPAREAAAWGELLDELAAGA